MLGKRFGSSLSLLLLGAFCSHCWAEAATRYDLNKVKDMGGFEGSAKARELLARNGFVVAEPSFKQIFEPYIKSPQTSEPQGSTRAEWRRGVLPSFITVDSAWHTYHVLVEEGVKQLEKVQGKRLMEFSRALLSAAKLREKEDSATHELVLYASVGLALQDAEFRKGVGGEEKRIVDGLRSGRGTVAVPIGFDVSAESFKAQSFYTQSPELSDYFAARQWYGTVVFRLRNLQETRLALVLASIVHDDAQLFAMWKQLTEPYDKLLAPTEDGSVGTYMQAIQASANAIRQSKVASTEAWVAEVQGTLMKQLAIPRVNDQLLSPEEFARFGEMTRGFRLLPSRQLPCAVCFQQTTEPKIVNRGFPSGLDFFAASPPLRSAAVVRALEGQFGKGAATQVMNSECGPLPNSIHGQAMELLANLQKPLPASVPAALRTEAWSDLQLWTQLAAWAEQRHTWALHTKINVNYMGMITPPAGMVAPYPDFFKGLAVLSKQTADALEPIMDKKFEARAVARNLLDAIKQRDTTKHFADDLGDDLQQLGLFMEQYSRNHQSEFKDADAYDRFENRLKDLAVKGADGGRLNESEMQLLHGFYEARQNAVAYLREFVPVCERLAELAQKTVNGSAVTDDDADWMSDYGVTLAKFHFYFGNSYEVPHDNFPIVTRVYSSPVRGAMLYAGLARPQALYVIATNGNALQLYRGAVLTYREFPKSDGELLDDDSWRAMVNRGGTPAAPPFTSSFMAETSIDELLQRLGGRRNDDGEEIGGVRDLMWQIRSRAKETDVPVLLGALADHPGMADEFAEIIGAMSWEPYGNGICELLKSGNANVANAAAHIFATRPEGIDTDRLINDFAKGSVHTRRLYCALLSRSSRNSAATERVLIKALTDRADGVRWQAAIGIGTAHFTNSDCVAALVRTLNDTNECVGAAAVHALVKLNATNVAPELMARLKKRLSLPMTAWENRPPEVMAIVKDIRDEGQRSELILDPDRLEWTIERSVTGIMRQRRTQRLPPDISHHIENHNYDIADAIIEGFGEWRFKPAAGELEKLVGTDYDFEATTALTRIDPDRMSARLLATAKNNQLDSYVREQALARLGQFQMTNCIRELIPLLDDVTPIKYSEKLRVSWEWRVCDSTAVTISRLLEWDHFPRMFLPPEKRDEVLKRARDWAKEQQVKN